VTAGRPANGRACVTHAFTGYTVDDEGIPWTLPAARIFFTATTVPEPGTFGLIGLALMLLANLAFTVSQQFNA
jgi:hypothetical protein